MSVHREIVAWLHDGGPFRRTCVHNNWTRRCIFDTWFRNTITSCERIDDFLNVSTGLFVISQSCMKQATDEFFIVQDFLYRIYASIWLHIVDLTSSYSNCVRDCVQTNAAGTRSFLQRWSRAMRYIHVSPWISRRQRVGINISDFRWSCWSSNTNNTRSEFPLEIFFSYFCWSYKNSSLVSPQQSFTYLLSIKFIEFCIVH